MSGNFRLELIIAFAFSAMLGIGQKVVETKELLPNTGEFFEWKISDSIEIYSGDNLFNFINGGADIYLEYGFDEAVKCDLINPQSNQIRCEIYRMSNDSAAYGIFTFNGTEKGLAVEAGNKALLYNHYIELWKDVFYIRCIAESHNQNFSDTLIILSELICNKIAEQGKEPALTRVFNHENLEIKNVKYFRGIIALNNVFNFGHGTIAGYSEGIAGNLDDKMIFCFAYKDAHKCKEWFASAKGKMQMNQKFTDLLPMETGFSIKSKSGESFCFKPYKRFIIVIKGMTWEESKPVIQQIERNLDGI